MSVMFDVTQPLWLPPGSVRAMIALTCVTAYIASGQDQLKDVALLVLGFYFGSRTQ